MTWQYRGDVNIQHGGFYWLDDAMGDDWQDYCDIVEIVPASDMGGPDNLFLISSGSVYMPEDKRDTAREIVGTPAEEMTRGDWVDAYKAYWGIDQRQAEYWVSIGPIDPYYSEGRGFGMPEEIMFVSGKTDLRAFVIARHYVRP